MKESEINLKSLFARYIIALVLFLLISYVYLILTPITLFSSVFLLETFYDVDVYYLENLFVINDNIFELVPACVAGSAFILLISLNLLTPMSKKNRVNSLIFLVLSLFVLNVIRISVFASLYIQNFTYFDFTHYAFWYFGSTALVVILWFTSVYIFKIKDIPLYTDIKLLIEEIKSNKKE